MTQNIDLYETPEWLDLHFRAKREHRRRTASLLDIRRGDRVLDIGCGNGVWTEIFLNCIGHNGQVVGLDPSKICIDRAILNAKQKKLTNVSYINESLERVSDLDGLFDAIILGNVSGYFEDFSHIIRVLKKKLRSGGRIILRQHDEGATIISPINEELLASVKLAIARNSMIQNADFDIFAGRRLRFDLKGLDFQRIDKKVVPFEAEAPFDEELSSYIKLTCEWMLNKSKPYIQDSEVLDWKLSTIDVLSSDKFQKDFYFFELEYLYHAYI